MTLVAYTADGRAKSKGQTYAPDGVVFSVRANAQSYANSVWTKRINWIAPDFDPLVGWDGVNSRFMPKRAGYYQVNGQVQFDTNTGAALVNVYKNGVQSGNSPGAVNTSGVLNSSASPLTTPIIYCNGTTDYLELWAYQYQPSAAAVNSNGALFTVALIGSSVGVAPEPWHYVGNAGEPAFQNGWVNYGSGYANARFRKVPDGSVQLQGLLKSGVASQAMWTMPLGYRPVVRLIFSPWRTAGAARIDVLTDGSVYAYTVDNTGQGVDGIVYPAEQ